MTFVYEGDEAGTVTVSAPFGEMTLKATKQVKLGQDGDETYEVIGIRAIADTEALMPAAAEIEACVDMRMKDHPGDEERLDLAVMSGTSSAQDGDIPVPVMAQVSIAVFDPPSAEVETTRRFIEETLISGRRLVVETFPGPCMVAQ